MGLELRKVVWGEDVLVIEEVTIPPKVVDLLPVETGLLHNVHI
jgi:hypothetical protein